MPIHAFPKRWGRLAGRPQSIRYHLAGVFLVFFLLVCVLGSFSIWRLSNFNRLSADVAEVWLPTTRVLGDLNNFTSDFRAIEGSNLLSTEPAEIAATETDMAALDRSIAQAERGFEKIAHDPAENDLYDRFKAHWTDYRKIVNQMLVLSRGNRKAEALAIYGGTSRVAYNAASDTLGQLTDQAVASAQIASDRLAVAYRQAFWLILLAVAIAGVMVVAALFHISRSISGPLLQLADRMRRLAANDTDIDVPETERADEIGEMAQATVVFRNNAIELMESQRMLARQAAMLDEQLAQEQRLALLQRNFVSMASHEFRTPMTIIDGHARRLHQAERQHRPRRDRRTRRQGAQRRAAHDPTDRQSAQLLAPDRRRRPGRRRTVFPSGRDGHGGASARGLPAAPRDGAGSADRRARRRGADAHGRRCKIAVSGVQQSSLQRHQILAGRRRHRGRRRVGRRRGRRRRRRSRHRHSRWPISTGCSSAITAAATSRGSSAPASASISSRWWSTCMAAPSR